MFVSLSLCLCLSHSSHTRTQTYSQADTQHRFQTPTQRKSKVSYTLSELAGIATPPTQLTFLHLPNFLSVPWRLLLSENMFYSLEKTENPSWNYTCQRLTAQLRVAERLWLFDIQPPHQCGIQCVCSLKRADEQQSGGRQQVQECVSSSERDGSCQPTLGTLYWGGGGCIVEVAWRTSMGVCTVVSPWYVPCVLYVHLCQSSVPLNVFM